jgi:hypothetical protein
MTRSDISALTACERANNRNLAYAPGPQFAGNAVHLVEAGLIVRSAGLTGGFWIGEEGKRKLVQIRAARLLSPHRRMT